MSNANHQMDAATLKEIFEKKYDRTEWVKVLRDLFSISTIYATPKDTGISNDKWEAKVYELGQFETKEGRLVGIFEVPINKKVKLERNKVALRDLLKNIYKEDVDAALVIFDQKGKWRFSYVSEISVRNPATNKRERKTTDPKRYTYILGEGERCKTAADRFSLINQNATAVELKSIEEAFSVEKLSKSFFDGYKKIYGKLVAYITGKDETGRQVYHPKNGFLKSVFDGEEKTARDFVKKMMGRIVFLYFLEKKGWLGVPETQNWGDGNENFLSDLFRDCAFKGDFYAQVLVPLFFDTLNTDRANDLFKIKDGIFTKGNYHKQKIPFLNGGLFDREAEETQFLVFKEDHFSELFDFFDQYNFTVYEDSPDEHTVAVDPEMLGHIFENLLEDNKDKGAFYTPKEIVHYMCQESLIEYLHTTLNPDATKETLGRAPIEKFIKHKEAGDIIDFDEAILRALFEVKICDPAIGSGAFPMGLLHEIYYAVELLHDAAPDTTTKVWKLKKLEPAKVKLAIIENSIYGVDIEQGAVDIARLRFWLSLVVDEEKPQPLPNLDYKIVVGDSLLPKLKIDGHEEIIEVDWGLSEGTKGGALRIQEEQKVKQIHLKEKQHLYFNVKVGKTSLHKEIEGLKADILINQLLINKESYAHKNPPKGGFAPTPKEIVYNHEREMELVKYDKLVEQLKEIKRRREDVCFFDWKFNFPEVMTAGVNKGDTGFDIVIGNPPYIQLQKLNTYADSLQKRNFKTFARTGDIYCLFYEEGFKILKSNGILTFITSNKWMRAAYGELLRAFFIDKANPIRLIDFGGYQVFESATVDTNILIAKKSAFQNCINTCVLDKGFSLNNMSDYFRHNTIVNSSFSSSGSWVVLNEVEKAIKEKIEKVGMPLKNWNIQINYGIKTGFNEAFIIDSETKDRLIKESPKSAEIIRPILLGKNIKRYSHEWENLWLINTHNGIKNKGLLPVNVRKDFPVVFTYLNQFKKQLEKRLDKGDDWTNLRNCAYTADFDKPKIAWGNLALKSQFSYIPGNYIINAPSPFFATDNLYLLAILNSKLGDYYIKQLGVSRSGGYIEYKPMFVEKLPIPEIGAEDQLEFSKLVQLIFTNQKKGIAVNDIESKIDEMVFKLYGITESEKMIINRTE